MVMTCPDFGCKAMETSAKPVTGRPPHDWPGPIRDWQALASMPFVHIWITRVLYIVTHPGKSENSKLLAYKIACFISD